MFVSGKSKRVAATLLCVALGVAGSAGAAWAKRNVTVATATIGGAFYPIGQAISSLVNKYVPDTDMTPEVTNGAVENPRLVAAGDSDFGTTKASMAYFALHGQVPYTQKLETIAAVGNLHPSVFHVVVLDKSDVKTFADIKGKRVAVGPAGGGTLPILEDLLREYGMTLQDIKASYLPYSDGFSQMTDGNVDVALALGGYPTAAVTEVATTQKVRLVPVPDDKYEAVAKLHPYYTKILVPKDIYKQDQDVVAVGMNNVLIVNSKLDADFVYEATKAIYGNLEEFGEINATAKQIDAANADKTPIPLHPGAQRYFDEKK